MASFEEIDKARRLLGLEEFASLKDIKRAYREKAFLYHPDKRGNENAQGEEMMKSLNQSYKLLMEYCSRYKYSFKEEDVDRAYPDDAYVRKYVYGWFEGM
jgi:curved DNA-binding protein CbpA